MAGSIAACLLILGLLVGSAITSLSSKLEKINFDTSRSGSPSHVVLIALDSRPGGDIGLPDALVLFDLGTGSYQQIPRNWTYSLEEPSVTLVKKYLGRDKCAPFCGIQGVYAFSRADLHDSPPEPPALDALARVIESEFQLESLAVVAFDLNWAYSFLTRIAPVEIQIDKEIPVGGVQTSEGYVGVKREIERGRSQYYGDDLYWIARSRHGTSDADRMGRQLRIISAISEQKSLDQILVASWTARGTFLTDLQFFEMVDIARTHQPQ